MKILIKAVITLYLTGVSFVCLTTLHAATITMQAYPAPLAAEQPGKGHQAIGRLPDIVPQVLQPLWIADTTEVVDKPDTGEVYTITGYCPCITCCGIWSADHPSRQGTGFQQHTASGTIPAAGRTAGSDWSVLGPGTVVEIEGYGRRVIEDNGNMTGKRIDLYFPTHEEARQFGRQELAVKIIEKE